jgi:phosphoserine phosphatase
MDSTILPSWRDTQTRHAIVEFVESVTNAGGYGYVPPQERIAVFDNDGTLWCEKPMPIELGFILERLATMAEADSSLRGRQPWQAAYERDYAWLSRTVTEHYQGDDRNVKVLLGGILKAFDGWSVDRYEDAAAAYLHSATHPTLRRRLGDCAYAPMLELLRYLEEHEFTTIIASGGDRDFMRPITEEVYGIPPERVVGSSNALRFENDTLVYCAEPDVFDDGDAKPVRIWSRLGRRPILAAGNSNGDIPMLRFAGAGGRPSLRLLVLHDDAQREFDYVAGAEQALSMARDEGWPIVSIRHDWTAVFGDERMSRAA